MKLAVSSQTFSCDFDLAGRLRYLANSHVSWSLIQIQCGACLSSSRTRACSSRSCLSIVHKPFLALSPASSIRCFVLISSAFTKSFSSARTRTCGTGKWLAKWQTWTCLFVSTHPWPHRYRSHRRHFREEQDPGGSVTIISKSQSH